jgi:pyridinium-3,5-biscarboxylic acid mononucleotide sulfurtransferase
MEASGVSAQFAHETSEAGTISGLLRQKYEDLRGLLSTFGRVLIAFSGGVDSSLVAKVAFDVLGPDKTLAVIAVSPSLAREEERDALALLNEIGLPYVTVETQEVDDPQYAANPINRCYFCKSHVYAALQRVAQERDFELIVDGFNADDSGEYRPGRKAGREWGVRSPLAEVCLGKDEIRELARHLGLSNWAKPPMACLSSRVEYGIPITPRILSQVDQAEAALRRLGFAELRVRHHDQLARIEVDEEMIQSAIARRAEIVAAVKAAGYTYVTLDLQGLRHGSMNEVITNRG